MSNFSLVDKDFVSLTEDPICADALVNRVKDPGAGAISTFYGTTRNNFENKAVTGLSYEAYHDMAIAEMQGICRKVWTEKVSDVNGNSLHVLCK